MKVFCVLLIVLAATIANAATLYNQAADSQNSSIGALTSYDPLPNAADDFTPNTDWLVTGATFRGEWRTGSGADPTTPTRQFIFNFYADANGPVDPPISSFTADASLTLAYIFHASNEDTSVYDITVNFPNSIQFSGGNTYWFSAVDDGLGRNGGDGFFWIISPEGNDVVAQKNQNDWTVYPQDQFYPPHDLVFSLIGSAVPEPSTLALLTLGGVIAFAAKRRRPASAC